jgi:hypothetical protein
MIPPSSLADGSNEVTLILVHGMGEERTLFGL